MSWPAFDQLLQRAVRALERAQRATDVLEGIRATDALQIALAESCRAAVLATVAGEAAAQRAHELVGKVGESLATDAYMAVASATDAATNAADVVEGLVRVLRQLAPPKPPH